MDDHELLLAIGRGDETALRTLFDRHAPWLASRLRRGLPTHAVEDVLQETFVAVWRGARAYRAEHEVGAWLWGIARRQAATWYRRNGRAEQDQTLDQPFEAADGRSTHADPTAEAADRVDLDQALAGLGPKGDPARELARLVFVEERSMTDIAGRLGIPEGTVKSRVHRLRRQLRATLRPPTGGT
jgi:RNA polymerase sigma-70 factor (ECF subfamily)